MFASIMSERASKQAQTKTPTNNSDNDMIDATLPTKISEATMITNCHTKFVTD